MRKPQIWELARLWPETSTKSNVQEFGSSSYEQFFSTTDIKLYSSNIKLVTLYNFLQYTNNKLFCSNSVSSTSFAKLCGHCSYTVYVPIYTKKNILSRQWWRMGWVGGIMFIIFLLQATKQFPTLYTHHIPFFLNIIVSFLLLLLLLSLSFPFIPVYFIPYVKRFISSGHSYTKSM